GVVRNPRVDVNVLDDGRAAIQHRPTADARLHWKALAFPQWSDRVLLSIKAAVTVAKDEGRAVRMDQGASRTADDVHDRRKVACQREALHDRHQLLHVLDDSTTDGTRGGRAGWQYLLDRVCQLVQLRFRDAGCDAVSPSQMLFPHDGWSRRHDDER